MALDRLGEEREEEAESADGGSNPRLEGATVANTVDELLAAALGNGAVPKVYALGTL